MSAFGTGVAGRVWQSVQRQPAAPALRVADRSYSYEELWQRAGAIAARLGDSSDAAASPVVGVLGYRSLDVYAAILACLGSGRAYLPLNPFAPPARNQHLLALSRAEHLIVTAEAAAAAAELIAVQPQPLTLIDCADLSDGARLWTPQQVDAEDLAYLLFTSGSTGVPKGVPIRQSNLAAYLDFLGRHYALQPDDRCSQAFELTFDGSVVDLFATWQAGACLCVPTRKMLLNPAAFIRDEALTLWFSVPSIPTFMRRMGSLKPGAFPTLRFSLFGGETLLVETARAWAKAAPNSVLENLYGPTESTVSVLHYRWRGDEPESWIADGTVPVGEPNAGIEIRIVDPEASDWKSVQSGELLVAGSQVAGRYWRDPVRSAQSFLHVDGLGGPVYRTGDRVMRADDGAGPLLYRGRLDDQIQVFGHRVELGEVERALRHASGIESAVVLGWPVVANGVAAGLEAFLEAPQVDAPAVLARIASALPDYMVPRHLHLLERFPLSENGKVDRLAMLRFLEERAR